MTSDLRNWPDLTASAERELAYPNLLSVTRATQFHFLILTDFRLAGCPGYSLETQNVVWRSGASIHQFVHEIIWKIILVYLPGPTVTVFPLGSTTRSVPFPSDP